MPNTGVDTEIDFEVENHFSLVVVQPFTRSCREWLQEHTEGTWYGGGLVVEPRYLDPLVLAMMEEGFVHG